MRADIKVIADRIEKRLENVKATGAMNINDDIAATEEFSRCLGKIGRADLAQRERANIKFYCSLREHGCETLEAALDMIREARVPYETVENWAYEGPLTSVELAALEYGYPALAPQARSISEASGMVPRVEEETEGDNY